MLCLLIGLGAVGCGSGSSSTGTSASTAGSGGGGSAGEGGKAPQPTSADNSITGYGNAAGGSEKAAVTAAVHGFLGAMAGQDYRGMCEALAASNREQLEAFSEGESSGASCAGALKTLLSPGVAKEARAAAQAPVTAVRIKGDTAFAIFAPKGGQPSYLVVKREGDSWKSISVTPGSPLEPTASQ